MWLLCLTELTNITETSNAMSTAPYIPSNDQAMAEPQSVPITVQPVTTPFPQHNGKKALKFMYLEQIISVIRILFDTI
jgi:hypothetical protein